LRNTIFVLLGLIVLLVVLVDLTPVQNFLARKATAMLSKKLHTKVNVAHVRIDFLDHVLLQGVYIEDQHHDTLLYAGEVQVRVNDWFIFKDKPILHYIGLHDAYAHLNRTDSSKEWNYQFIADAFATGKKDTGSKPFVFDLKTVDIKNVRFHMDDAWGGEDLDFDVGSLALNAKTLDFDKKIIDISKIDIGNTVVSLSQFDAGKPYDSAAHNGKVPIDTTPFNDAKWTVKANDLSLDNCGFNLTSNDDTPIAEHFDEQHLAIKNIHLDISKITITGDTIRGSIDHLSAQDRSGLAIKEMHSKVTVSPIASICDNLYLQTNYSKVGPYYAMRYKHFPNFTSYIDSVVMEARLKDAVIDERDIAYFAPQLRQFPTVLRVSGEAKGTVANITAKNLSVTDGASIVSGNVSMKGLPDIYKTYIVFDQGTIFTTGAGVLKYAPSLKYDSTIDVSKINYAYFKGKYEGYIENFAVDGVITSNLGTITSNIKMDVPGFNSDAATYSGTIKSDKLLLGAFLRQPDLGAVSLKLDVSGNAFDPARAQINIDGTIYELNIKGYPYKNILAHGTLAKKQFDGTLLVDDPNLALEFDGSINFSQKDVNVNAKAHLLSSNFYALHLTTDTITASADFDLNCTGSNIDNFSGYAKLYNIDVKRNQHKLALDSVYVNSEIDSGYRMLTVESNDIVGTIKGNYQLSKLPASFQYYLSGYMPNYINAPSKYAPQQNLTFNIKTASVDSLLGVIAPTVKGFDNSQVSGSLNTTDQILTLNVSVPYGSIGKFHMSNIAIAGQGNFSSIGVTASVDNLAIADSFLSGSLSVTSTIGNDSVAFNIATTSVDTTNSATLNGQIVARKDSLFLNMRPSQFYLNQSKWDIAGGSSIVYTSKYLKVQDLLLKSGVQKITASTELENNDQTILVTTENLDLGQLGSWAGLAAYQPDGRVNGTIKVNKIFHDLYVSTNLQATDVKLGTDTVGTINIIGYYDGAKKLVSFDPQTGIYRNNASIIAAGNISFDTTQHQPLNGSIQFNNAPVAWTSPFLAGVLSHLSGTLNGTVNFQGTSYDPQFNGTVALRDAAMKLDYLGTNYTIPSADIEVNNHRINFGKVALYDVHKNVAYLSGYFSHNFFKDMSMRLTLKSNKVEVMNLTSNDNNIFYGNLVASLDSFTIRGPFNNIQMHMYNAAPAEKSHIYIPVNNSGDIGTYNYVSFKSYGKSQDKPAYKTKNKMNINIEANMNDLAEMTIILDPSSGDAITARGNGVIQMQIPTNNDMRINGRYTIDEGDYTFTFKKLLITRKFSLNSGSTITFNGPFSQTDMNVDATYSPQKTRLYDLLSEAEKAPNYMSSSDLSDAQTPQQVNVILHMNGSLKTPKLTFNIDLPDRRSVGTYAYTKLQRLNQDDRQLFDQVASLLLIGDFIPPEGIGTGTAITGAINNMSQIISGTASSQLTNIVNKILGNRDITIDVRYTNYNYSDNTTTAANRNQVNLGISKNYFHDRLIVEVGGTSDWGRPASTSTTSSFNIAGDFRVQYLVNQAGGLRLNVFRTSDYDVTLDRDITRSGVGISWRKTFDGLDDFFHGRNFSIKAKAIEEQKLRATDDTSKHAQGTE